MDIKETIGHNQEKQHETQAREQAEKRQTVQEQHPKNEGRQHEGRTHAGRNPALIHAKRIAHESALRRRKEKSGLPTPGARGPQAPRRVVITHPNTRKNKKLCG